MKKIILIIIFIMCITQTVYGDDTNYVEDKLSTLGISGYDGQINRSINGEYDFSFSDVVKRAMTGKLTDVNIIEIFRQLIKGVFKEVFQNAIIIKNVITISLLVAFLKILTENFKNQGVNEIGFYTGYMVIATLLVNSFNLSIVILQDTVQGITSLINAIMPVLVGVLVMSGAPTSGAIFSTVILTSLKFLSFFMENLFIPLIAGTVVLNIVNYITPKEVLNKLIEFLKWITRSSLRVIVIGLGFIISLQRITAPVINSTINKTAKTFISFVPVVGDAMNGAIDGVMHFVGLLKGGVLVGVVIAMLLCALVPIFKLISLIIVYKITAVLIEPISDNRITSAINVIGEYTKLVLSGLVIFIFLFIFFVVVMLSISG